MGLFDKIGNQIQNSAEKITQTADNIAQQATEGAAKIAGDCSTGIAEVRDHIETDASLMKDVLFASSDSVISDTQQSFNRLQQSLSDVLNDAQTIPVKENLKGLVTVSEACVDFVLSSCSRMLHGDQTDQLQRMAGMLDTLKDAKSKTMPQLIESMGKSSDMVRGISEDVQRKLSLAPPFVFATTAASVAATVAVVGAVAKLSTDIALAGGSTAAAAGKSAVEIGANVALATAAITISVAELSVKMAQQLPNVLNAMGFDDSAATAEKILNSPQVKTLSTCALLSTAILSASIQTIAQSTKATGELAGDIAVNAASLGVTVASYAVERELQSLQQELGQLQGNLQDMEVELQEIMIGIQQTRIEKDKLQEAVKGSEEQMSTIMQNLEKAAQEMNDAAEQIRRMYS